VSGEKPWNLWTLVRSQWLLLLTVGLYLWRFSVDPAGASRALGLTVRTFGNVLPLVLAVMGLIGLLQIWISRDLIVRLLGRDAGIKALLVAALCGTLLIGPAYLIFPLLMAIKNQGARWAVVVTVLAAYTVKLHLLPLEAGFLGWKFSLLRTLFTLLLAIPLGLAVEWIVERPRRGSNVR